MERNEIQKQLNDVFCACKPKQGPLLKIQKMMLIWIKKLTIWLLIFKDTIDIEIQKYKIYQLEISTLLGNDFYFTTINKTI